jgi:hypothetical protein
MVYSKCLESINPSGFLGSIPSGRDFIMKDKIIEINKKLGIEFHTDFGLGANKSNLDYAISLKDPYDIAKEIFRGHPRRK